MAHLRLPAGPATRAFLDAILAVHGRGGGPLGVGLLGVLGDAADPGERVALTPGPGRAHPCGRFLREAAPAALPGPGGPGTLLLPARLAGSYKAAFDDEDAVAVRLGFDAGARPRIGGEEFAAAIVAPGGVALYPAP